MNHFEEYESSIIGEINSVITENDLTKSVDVLENVTGSLSKILLKLLELIKHKNLDLFIIAEKISIVVDFYVRHLIKLFNSDDIETKFWAASLLVNHGIDYVNAETYLLSEVKEGKGEKAQLATTLLFKAKSKLLNSAIRFRLDNSEDISDSDKSFFENSLL